MTILHNDVKNHEMWPTDGPASNQHWNANVNFVDVARRPHRLYYSSPWSTKNAEVEMSLH